MTTVISQLGKGALDRVVLTLHCGEGRRALSVIASRTRCKFEEVS